MKKTASRISVVVALVLTVFAFIGLMPIWAQTPGVTFTVNSQVDAVDVNPGDGVCATEEGACTLRAAIQETNALPGADTIEAPAGTYVLTIPGKFEDESATGDLDVVDDLTIMGAGMDETIIDGNQLDRVLDLRCPGGDPYPMVGVEMGDCSGWSQGELQVVISGVTVQHGDTGSNNGDGGGGINAQTTRLTIIDSLLSNNYADNGGGIYQYNGTVTIVNSELSDNDARTGGGIYTDSGLDSVSLMASHATDNDVRGVYSTTVLTVSYSTISGNTAQMGGGIHIDGDGTVMVNHTTLSSNSAEYMGGGIYNLSNNTVMANHVTFSENSAINGGGIYNFSAGTLIVNHSTFSSNLAHTLGDGAGIYSYRHGSITISHSTFSDNWADAYGAGIYNQDDGPITISHSTFSGNRAYGRGAGIYNRSDSPITINYSTFSNNQASSGGGGIHNYYDTPINVRNSIIANNTDVNCDGIIASQGYNLDSDNTCNLIAPGDLPNMDPLLGLLRANGGATETHALLPGSPAIDAGSCPSITADQREYPRPIDDPDVPNANDSCDIGAYEVQPIEFALSKTVDNVSPLPGQGITYTIVINNYGFLIATQSVISDTLPDNLTFSGPVTLHPFQPEAVLAQDASDFPMLASNLTIPPQTSITLTFPITVNENTPLHLKIRNTAAITSAEITTPHAGSVTIKVICQPMTVVLNTADSGPGSLRQAIIDVCDGGDINFDLVYPATITLTTGELAITKTLAIHGPGVNNLVISGNNSFRVFNVSGEMYLTGLTIRDGVIYSSYGGGIYNTGILNVNNISLLDNASISGGGIGNSFGIVTIDNSILSGNSAGNGGGIYNASGTITVSNCTLLSNLSELGGGIANFDGLATINNSSLADNHGMGGAIYNSSGIVTVNNSTLSNNLDISTGGGGGIYNTSAGVFTINESILSGNMTPEDSGGGILNSLSSMVILNDSTLSGNWASSYGGGIYNRSNSMITARNSIFADNSADHGGGIYNTSGTVTITHSSFLSNLAISGGGINNNSYSSYLTLGNSTLSDNVANDNGGAILNFAGTVTITNSTLMNNSATGGGGIADQNGGSVTINSSILTGNLASNKGGAIFTWTGGTVTVTNSTLTNNLADEGGGIYNWYFSTITVTHSTLAGNSANYGGGIHNDADGRILMWDSITANSPNGSDCIGTVVSRGHNLDSDGSCGLDGPGDLPNTDPLLDQLKDNGGATLTHALLPGSPAIDAGDNGNCPATDQRGVARPKGAGCDIGAYEREPIVLRLDYQYGTNDGSMGTGRYTLLADNTFVDEQNGSGIWQYQPTPSPRLALQYNPGFACNALSIGNFTGPGQVQGWRLCRDGSGVIGLWTGTVATGAIAQ